MPSLFIYGSAEVVSRAAAAANEAVSARAAVAAVDPGVALVREIAKERLATAAAEAGARGEPLLGSAFLTSLRSYLRGRRAAGDASVEPAFAPESARARVRSEHAAVLALPLPAAGASKADVAAACASLAAALRGEEGGGTSSAFASAAAALRARYEAEYGAAIPWPGAARVVTYGLRLGCENARAREDAAAAAAAAAAGAGSGSGAPPPPAPTAALAFLALAEPRRADFAVFAAAEPGGRVAVVRGEEDGPSCLAGIGGAQEALDDGPFAAAIREAEEEACLDLRPLLAGLAPPQHDGGEAGATAAAPSFFGLDAAGKDPRYWLRLPDDASFTVVGEADVRVVVEAGAPRKV